MSEPRSRRARNIHCCLPRPPAVHPKARAYYPSQTVQSGVLTPLSFGGPSEGGLAYTLLVLPKSGVSVVAAHFLPSPAIALALSWPVEDSRFVNTTANFLPAAASVLSQFPRMFVDEVCADAGVPGAYEHRCEDEMQDRFHEECSKDTTVLQAVEIEPFGYAPPRQRIRFANTAFTSGDALNTPRTLSDSITWVASDGGTSSAIDM